jgi:hypothetical protein
MRIILVVYVFSRDIRAVDTFFVVYEVWLFVLSL